MIRLQFAEQHSLPSWAIGVFEHGWASHVDTIMPDNRLLGARHDGGVLIREPDYANFERKLIVELPTSDTITQIYLQDIKGEIGKPYDNQAIEAFVIGRDWRKPDAWFCSELVAAKLEDCGYLHRLVTPINKITPGMLLTVLSAFVTLPEGS